MNRNALRSIMGANVNEEENITYIPIYYESLSVFIIN